MFVQPEVCLLAGLVSGDDDPFAAPAPLALSPREWGCVNSRRKLMTSGAGIWVTPGLPRLTHPG